MSLKSYLPLAMVAPVAFAAGVAGIGAAIGQSAPPPAPMVSGQGNVTLEGEVREVFGNKFILENKDGRRLIETGPEGGVRAPMAVGDKVTVEGLQRNGFVHASAIAKANGPRVELGPMPGPGRPGPREMEAGYREDTVLQAARQAGYTDPRVIDVKKKHAEVAATGSDGRAYELHVEFDGRIRKQEDATLVRDESAVKSLIEKAGYTYGGSMRPEKKHVIVQATNSRGEKVEIDVHRDGTIKKERRVF